MSSFSGDVQFSLYLDMTEATSLLGHDNDTSNEAGNSIFVLYIS